MEESINFIQNVIPTGWECPRCHKINAPHVNCCDCKPITYKLTTTNPDSTACDVTGGGPIKSDVVYII